MSTNKLTKDKILAQLNKGDMFAIEIKQALKISNIELWDSIKELREAGEIHQYFRMTTPSATICFCLPGRKKEPPSVRWSRGVKPWTPAIN
jgi:hypothetical protein